MTWLQPLLLQQVDVTWYFSPPDAVLPFGTFVPTMKISTNSTLAKNKPGWIDFNAGVIVENEPMEKTCERFIDYIIKVASGEFVNNEKKGYREIAIFKTGVTL